MHKKFDMPRALSHVNLLMMSEKLGLRILHYPQTYYAYNNAI